MSAVKSNECLIKAFTGYARYTQGVQNHPRFLDCKKIKNMPNFILLSCHKTIFILY